MRISWFVPLALCMVAAIGGLAVGMWSVTGTSNFETVIDGGASGTTAAAAEIRRSGRSRERTGTTAGSGVPNTGGARQETAEPRADTPVDCTAVALAGLPWFRSPRAEVKGKAAVRDSAAPWFGGFFPPALPDPGAPVTWTSLPIPKPPATSPPTTAPQTTTTTTTEPPTTTTIEAPTATTEPSATTTTEPPPPPTTTDPPPTTEPAPVDPPA